MEDYIELSTVLDILNECRCSDCTNDKPQPCRLCQFQDFYTKLMKDGQTTKQAESKVGRWLFSDCGGIHYYKCSCCNYELEVPLTFTKNDVIKYKRYCTSCGAKMGGGD